MEPAFTWKSPVSVALGRDTLADPALMVTDTSRSGSCGRLTFQLCRASNPKMPPFESRDRTSRRLVEASIRGAWPSPAAPDTLPEERGVVPTVRSPQVKVNVTAALPERLPCCEPNVRDAASLPQDLAKDAKSVPTARRPPNITPNL